MWCYLVLFLLLVSGLRADDTLKGEELTGMMEGLNAFLKSKCAKNVGENAFANLGDLQENVVKCMNRVDTKIPDARFSCSYMPKKMYGCVDDVLHKIKPCLDAEEKYLPNLILDVFNSTIENQCKDGGSSFFAQMNAAKNSICNREFEEMMPLTTQICGPKLKVVEDLKQTDFVIKKSHLCSDVHIASSCALEVIQKHCKDNALSKFVESNFEPMLQWCNKHNLENEVDSNPHSNGASPALVTYSLFLDLRCIYLIVFHFVLRTSSH